VESSCPFPDARKPCKHRIHFFDCFVAFIDHWKSKHDPVDHLRANLSFLPELRMEPNSALSSRIASDFQLL